MHQNNNFGNYDDIKLEYRQIRKRYPKLRFQSVSFQNASKNRYKDVIPMERTRVKLKGLCNDYINANHIQLKYTMKSKNKYFNYISTQAPTRSTAKDFWKMVWDQETTFIMMLTDFEENGRKKASLYWNPNINVVTRFVYESYETLNNEKYHLDVVLREKYFVMPNIHLRIFDIITPEGKSRRVHHFQYLDWKDNGTPENLTDVTFLIGYMNIYESLSDMIGYKNFIPIIHCSAGVGRTGAFISACVVKEFLLNGITPEIPRIVCDLRKCRDGMVQTYGQYIFIYNFKDLICRLHR